MNELNKKLFIAFLIIFSLGMTALLVINTATNSKIQDLNPKYDVPNFELTNFNGDIFTDNDLINKITIVSFIFTRCEGACPIMSKNFRDLQTSFKDSDLVQFVSITVDPEYDSDSILKSFSNQYSNNDNWYFLRGDILDIIELSEQGFKLSASLLPGGHSTQFVLVGQKKQIRKFYEGIVDANVRELKDDIVILIDEG